jgi:hypothetical protein
MDPFGNKQNVKYQVGDAWMTFRSMTEVVFRPSAEKGISLLSQNPLTGEQNQSKATIKDLKYADLKKEFTQKRTRKFLGLWERYAPKTQEMGYILKNEKNKLRYGKILEANPGETIDIDYSINSMKLLEEIILNSPQDISSFSQKVFLNNAYAKKEGEEISFYNKGTNEKIWTLPEPIMYEYFEKWDEAVGNPVRDENFGLHYDIKCENTNVPLEGCQALIITKVIDEEGKIWLASEARQYPVVVDLSIDYVFTTTTDKWAYQKGAAAPTSPTDAGLVAATTTDYTAISSSNDSRWSTSLATTTGQYDSQVYRFTINQIFSEIASINVQWEGYGQISGTSTTDLRVWKNASSTWVQLDSIDFTSAADLVASGTISSGIADYIDASTTFSVLVTTGKGLNGNGESCVTGTDCSSGYCYTDADSDNYGTSTLSNVCKAAASLGNDCCDSDNRAYPGQVTYYTTARTTCGGYDFNCNGSDTASSTNSNCRVCSSCTTANSCSSTYDCDVFAENDLVWVCNTTSTCGAHTDYHCDFEFYSDYTNCSLTDTDIESGSPTNSGSMDVCGTSQGGGTIDATLHSGSSESCPCL